MVDFRIIVCSIALAACATAEPVYDYDCQLERSCNASFDLTHYPVTGTVDEIREFAHDWGAACQAITAQDVIENRCDYVWCNVKCRAE